MHVFVSSSNNGCLTLSLQAFETQMNKQNEMMMARRKSRKQARFDEEVNTARELIKMAAENSVNQQTAQDEEKNKQGDLVSVKFT